MELQWPLILFVLFVAWSAGLFATLSIYAWRGESSKTLMPALISSAVLLVIGGIAVFFHLQHWERIFNGFGHITSGITQELIFIVIMFVFMVVTFAFFRRGSENEKLPRWLTIVNTVAAAALVCVMGNSYLMASRPAWDSIFEILSLLGAACVLGPATFVVISTLQKENTKTLDEKLNMWGSSINAVTMLCYIIAMAVASGMFTQVGYSFDSTHPTEKLIDISSLSPLSGSAAYVTICAVIFAALAVIFAVLGKKKGDFSIYAWAITVSAVISCVLLRVVFYLMGESVFMFY